MKFPDNASSPSEIYIIIFWFLTPCILTWVRNEKKISKGIILPLLLGWIGYFIWEIFREKGSEYQADGK